MTWLEVVDDAVKIGLGGFVGWLIARGSRSHEFEKERRRRKQDCLERVVEHLDETESSVEMLMVTAAVLVNERKENTQEWQVRMSEKVNENYEASNAAETKLYRSRSKLTVFGFVRCAKALKVYHSKIVSYFSRVFAWQIQKKDISEDDVRVAHAEVTIAASDLRNAVAEAITNL